MKKLFTIIAFVLCFTIGIALLGLMSGGALAFGAGLFALAGMVWFASKAASWVLPSEAKDNLQEEVENLTNENNELRTDNGILNEKLRATQAKLKERESVANTVRQAWEKLCEEKNTLREEGEGLSKENASLLEEGAELRAENKGLEEDNKSLQERESRLKSQIEKLRERMRILHMLARIFSQNPGIVLSVVVGIGMLLAELFFPGAGIGEKMEINCWPFNR